MKLVALLTIVIAVTVTACGDALPAVGDSALTDAAPQAVNDAAGDAGEAKPDVLALAAGGCADASMRRVGNAGAEFCIDAREVSNVAYQAFVDANPSPTFRAECTWKTSHAWSLPAGASYEVGGDALPVVGVDWCDADAYCAWKGAKLCSRERWSAACSGAGARKYSYGDTFNKDACNLSGQKEAVGSRTSCQGAYDGVFDLLGNADEWGDTSFKTEASSNVDRTRTLTGLDCQSEGALVTRAYRSDGIGFRCCADD